MTTPAITLRLWSESEATRVTQLFNTPALLRNLTANLPNPYREEHALEFIRKSMQDSPTGMERAIEYHGEVVGTIGARLKGSTATIGYWIGQNYWGQGIMSQVLPRFIEALPAHITQLEAQTFAFNTASQALLRRNGFTQLPGNHYERSYDQQIYEGHSFARNR